MVISIFVAKTPRKEDRKNISDIKHSNIFIGQSPKTKEIKAKISKWYLVKLISFCTEKETINKMKRQPIDRKKIFANG